MILLFEMIAHIIYVYIHMNTAHIYQFFKHDLCVCVCIIANVMKNSANN
jgi:hypothetical protein